MKRIIYNDENFIDLSDVKIDVPIFAVKDNKIVGMIAEIKRNFRDEYEWILLIGGRHGSYGYNDTLKQCIIEGIKCGYTFYIDINVEDNIKK